MYSKLIGTTTPRESASPPPPYRVERRLWLGLTAVCLTAVIVLGARSSDLEKRTQEAMGKVRVQERQIAEQQQALNALTRKLQSFERKSGDSAQELSGGEQQSAEQENSVQSLNSRIAELEKENAALETILSAMDPTSTSTEKPDAGADESNPSASQPGLRR